MILPLQSALEYFSAMRPTLVARIYGVVRLCNCHSFLQKYGIKHSREESRSALPPASNSRLRGPSRSLASEVQLVSDCKHLFRLCKKTKNSPTSLDNKSSVTGEKMYGRTHKVYLEMQEGTRWEPMLS